MATEYTGVAVVGMHFRDKEGVPATATVQNLLPGATITLKREPDNPFDAYAIQAYVGETHIGYIEAKSACFISPLWDENPDAEITCTVEDFEVRRNNLHPICFIQLDAE